jgi:ubiquinol-cytochrome c reductase cytochrome b subunit
VFTLMAQLGTLYYYAFFLVILPVLGLVETPRRIPNSITEAVLEKTARA